MTDEPSDADLAVDCERLQSDLRQALTERDAWKRWCEEAESKLAALEGKPLVEEEGWVKVAVGWEDDVHGQHLTLELFRPDSAWMAAGEGKTPATLVVYRRKLEGGSDGT